MHGNALHPTERLAVGDESSQPQRGWRGGAGAPYQLRVCPQNLPGLRCPVGAGARSCGPRLRLADLEKKVPAGRHAVSDRTRRWGSRRPRPSAAGDRTASPRRRYSTYVRVPVQAVALTSAAYGTYGGVRNDAGRRGALPALRAHGRRLKLSLTGAAVRARHPFRFFSTVILGSAAVEASRRSVLHVQQTQVSGRWHTRHDGRRQDGSDPYLAKSTPEVGGDPLRPSRRAFELPASREPRLPSPVALARFADAGLSPGSLKPATVQVQRPALSSGEERVLSWLGPRDRHNPGKEDRAWSATTGLDGGMCRPLITRPEHASACRTSNTRLRTRTPLREDRAGLRITEIPAR